MGWGERYPIERGRSVNWLSITFRLTNLVILPIPSGSSSNLLLPRSISSQKKKRREEERERGKKRRDEKRRRKKRRGGKILSSIKRVIKVNSSGNRVSSQLLKSRISSVYNPPINNTQFILSIFLHLLFLDFYTLKVEGERESIPM